MTDPARHPPSDPSSLLAAIVASSDDVIISKTLDGIVTSWNAAAVRVFGYTEEEAIGRSIVDLVIPDELQTEEDMILSRLRKGERIEHFETVRRTKDGRRIDVSLTVSPVHDRSGAVVGASKIARDITERHRAARELARLYQEAQEAADERARLLESERYARTQAERLSALKDEFLSTLSHELRSPLSAILGWSQVLRQGHKNEADLKSGLNIIERNARIQTQLIDDLLDMSRITAGKMRLDVQPVVPATVVQAAVESVRPAAEAREIRLEILLDESAGPVSGDPARLQQVMWNLLSNAIKFTARHGRVTVLLERVNSHVEMSVTDTGVGIRPEFLPHVFERFRQADASTTRKFGGLGLGLAIVKHLVELHGGSVMAKSRGEGQGATFCVLLPVMPVRLPRNGDVHPRAPKAASLESDPVDLAGVTVLVVDDDADGRHLIVRLLQDCGAQVVEAADAHAALGLIREAPPTVLISDIGMPDVDGYELLRRVRSLPPERGGRIPAVALTAFARSEDRTRALRAGYLAHVAKPVEPSELLATIAAVASR